MFAYSSHEEIIPSLVFTKAELIYVVSVLLNSIEDTDNKTRIELVEIRHYLNQIRDRITSALYDGTISKALFHNDGNNTPNLHEKELQVGKDSVPSMKELKEKFPNLSEYEIKEIIDKVREEKKNKDEEYRTKKDSLSSPPSFIAKPMQVRESKDLPMSHLSPKEEKDITNSRKFAQLLGNL